MSVYEELGIRRIINASDTYTRLGGSRMSAGSLGAMVEAADSFVDIPELSRKICEKIAARTGNEGAFLSSGAAACVVLAVSACMTGEESAAYHLPDTARCKRNEVVIYAAQVECPMLPYWHLTELSGAKLIKAGNSIKALKEAVTDQTACIVYFAGSIYEMGVPSVEEIAQAARELGIPFLVDAAAQLPPKSNLWYYTKEAGADAVIFSGGKFLMGPQTTGLVLGKKELVERCAALASPNVKIGRPYKVGKEEYLAIYQAVMEFLDCDEAAQRKEMNACLDQIAAKLAEYSSIRLEKRESGRLGQSVPLLVLEFLDQTTGKECYDFLFRLPEPIDIGYYEEFDPTGKSSQVFINPINIRTGEIEVLVKGLKEFLNRNA